MRALINACDELQRRKSGDRDDEDEDDNGGVALQAAAVGIPDPESGPIDEDEERPEDGVELSVTASSKPSTHTLRKHNPWKPPPMQFNQIHLGAGQRAGTIDALMRAHSGQHAFANFGRRLQRYLTAWLRALNIISPEQGILLYANTMVSDRRGSHHNCYSQLHLDHGVSFPEG